MSYESNINDSIRSLAGQGLSVAQIAETLEIGAERVTLALAARKSTRSEEVIESITSLGDRAVSYMGQVIDDPDIHPAFRLKAAMYVADIASGIRAPVTHVAPEIPATIGLKAVFTDMFEAYHKALETARTEKPCEAIQLVP